MRWQSICCCFIQTIKFIRSVSASCNWWDIFKCSMVFWSVFNINFNRFSEYFASFLNILINDIMFSKIYLYIFSNLLQYYNCMYEYIILYYQLETIMIYMWNVFHVWVCVCIYIYMYYLTKDLCVRGWSLSFIKLFLLRLANGDM